jgi:hypothetical protein
LRAIHVLYVLTRPQIDLTGLFRSLSADQSSLGPREHSPTHHSPTQPLMRHGSLLWASALSLALVIVTCAAAAAPAAVIGDGEAPAGGARALLATALLRFGRRVAGASILLPLADDDGRVDGLLRGDARGYWRRAKRPARKAAAAAIGGAAAAQRRPPAGPPPPASSAAPYAGACPAAAQPLLAALDRALSRDPARAARAGAVDWGLVEPEDAASAAATCNAPGGCASNNPSAPYGLVVLPLAPEEVGFGLGSLVWTYGHVGWQGVWSSMHFLTHNALQPPDPTPTHQPEPTPTRIPTYTRTSSRSCAAATPPVT